MSTETVAPDPQATLALPQGGPVLRAGDEVLSFVSRSLEPYRGFHAFMRALPAVMAARPQAQVVMARVPGPDLIKELGAERYAAMLNSLPAAYAPRIAAGQEPVRILLCIATRQ